MSETNALTPDTPEVLKPLLAKIEADKLYTEAETAEIFRWSIKTTQKRRALKLKPDWVKLGRSVRYPGKSISEFIIDGADFRAVA